MGSKNADVPGDQGAGEMEEQQTLSGAAGRAGHRHGHSVTEARREPHPAGPPAAFAEPAPQPIDQRDVARP